MQRQYGGPGSVTLLLVGLAVGMFLTAIQTSVLPLLVVAACALAAATAVAVSGLIGFAGPCTGGRNGQADPDQRSGFGLVKREAVAQPPSAPSISRTSSTCG
ncbi:hypothetical protein P3T29_000238 [Kitasatospora sp. MAP5-34]|nr:hypothetical protein [Kitasatospora sp. MAP5-34]